LQRPNVARAVFGASEPELAGLTPVQFRELKARELQARRPDDVRRLQHERVVLDALKESMRTAEIALQNTRTRLDAAKPVQKVEATPQGTWR
jgi:hypothetical protein